MRIHLPAQIIFAALFAAAPIQTASDTVATDPNLNYARPTRGASETVALIPYGCTKFRVSMFPVNRPRLGPEEQ